VFLGVAIWFGSIQPKQNAIYPPEFTMPHAQIDGDLVTFRNIRNFDYQTKDDFLPIYETRSYSLDSLETLDLYMNYWAGNSIAHTFVSFGFSDGRYLAVSIETRREVGETYGTLKGFFKQYELIYIWGDERDLVRLRTNYRKERAYLYRLNMPRNNLKDLFLFMVKKTNSLYENPAFYNTIKQNCTSALANDIVDSGAYDIPWWKKRLATGSVDKRAYSVGMLDTSKPFDELRKEAHIDKRANAADKSPEFSRMIRTHLSN